MCMLTVRRRRWLGIPLDRPVEVSGTRIFARLDEGVQSLAYELRLRAGSELAMVLPLPVAPRTGEDGVTFLDMSEAHALFDDLERLFAVPRPQSAGELSRSAPVSMPLLVVHSVGAFEASYVPTLLDFARLDPRFRLPDSVWEKLPRYRDFGFAVFKLKKGEQRVHPMAFRFPTRAPRRLFFPTVHVHDGEVHARASFDHELYWQGPHGAEQDSRSNLDAPAQLAERTRGLVVSGPVRRRTMRGTHDNDDVWIE